MIPVDTVPAGYTREDVGLIPTPGHLQIDVTPLMVRGYVRRGRRRGRKSFGINDLQLFYLFWKTLAKSGFYLRAKRIFCSYVYRGQVKFSFFWSLNYAIWYG